jgi:hypothetical protein
MRGGVVVALRVVIFAIRIPCRPEKNEKRK